MTHVIGSGHAIDIKPTSTPAFLRASRVARRSGRVRSGLRPVLARGGVELRVRLFRIVLVTLGDRVGFIGRLTGLPISSVRLARS